LTPTMRVTFVVVLLLLLGLVSAERTRWWQLKEGYSFEKYASEFNKLYQDDKEFLQRKDIFERKLEKIRLHNEDPTKTWKEGVNQFTDRTPEEFKQLLGLRKADVYRFAAKHDSYNYAPPKASPIPDSIDWRTSGVVSAVKDQGQCGSCWSFASSETIESHAAIKTGDLAVLSEQQILGCTSNPNDCGGTGGCGGGTVEVAYGSILNVTFGIASEWTYPYMSYWGTNYPCKFSKSTTPVAVQLSNYTKLPSNQYSPLLTAVATVGPIAISVDASSWDSYESGIWNGCNQTNPTIDHAVQLVGYGNDTTSDYWLVRNSWAPSWGEHGYIRLYRSATVECGTDLHPSEGDGCNNGPPTVKVCGTCGILYDSVYPIIST